jgi:hypothetical protein
MTRCQFIPPYLLANLAASHPDPDVCRDGLQTLSTDTVIRTRRADVAPAPAEEAAAPATTTWTVYTAGNGTSLPGERVRAEGDPQTGDPAADEAYTGVEASLAMFREVFDRASYDGKGAPVTATVHYQRNYDNAFWDGEQLVFGDGDGQVFTRFTKPIDVLGHEFTHAVTQFTAGLTYQDQSGALNESVSDAFACCLKQRVLGQSVTEADWLIGQGIFLPSVHGTALRSMAQPGTAYDDPTIGKDPQVGSMADFVHTTSDNGGVHTNSGIPNRAFYLAATALGGNSWEHAGPIWYAALTSGIGPDTDFAGFAAATVTAAEAVSADAASAVRGAWEAVGVLGGGATAAPAPTPAGSTPAGSTTGPATVSVRRSGGFAGRQVTGEVRLGGDDPRSAEAETLVGRIDLRAVTGLSDPQPDRYIYMFVIRGDEVTVGEQDLTPELEQLARLVLER